MVPAGVLPTTQPQVFGIDLAKKNPVGAVHFGTSNT